MTLIWMENIKPNMINESNMMLYTICCGDQSSCTHRDRSSILTDALQRMERRRRGGGSVHVAPCCREETPSRHRPIFSSSSSLSLANLQCSRFFFRILSTKHPSHHIASQTVQTETCAPGDLITRESVHAQKESTL